METSHIILDPNQLTWYFIYFILLSTLVYIQTFPFFTKLPFPNLKVFDRTLFAPSQSSLNIQYCSLLPINLTPPSTLNSSAICFQLMEYGGQKKVMKSTYFPPASPTPLCRAPFDYLEVLSVQEFLFEKVPISLTNTFTRRYGRCNLRSLSPENYVFLQFHYAFIVYISVNGCSIKYFCNYLF